MAAQIIFDRGKNHNGMPMSTIAISRRRTATSGTVSTIPPTRTTIQIPIATV